MSYKKNYSIFFIAATLLSVNIISCSKGGGDDSPADPCAGKTITVTATPTPTSGCGPASGTITASASGSSGFTYKISTAATFQASGIFNNLSAGSYVITAKDADGCTKTTNVTVTSTGGNFTITTNVTATSGCSSADGSISVTATGSSGYQYKLQGGTYGASSTFNNLVAGAHTVFVKDGAGCESSQIATVIASTTPGTRFAAVRSLLNAKCVTCHSPGGIASFRDWTINCNVVDNKALINQRAVVIGDMPQGGPPLSAAEKQVITDWINAGGLLTN